MNYFLTITDFYGVYTAERFDKLISSDDSIWQDELSITIEDISGYLRARYDCNLIFAPLLTYDAGTTYAVGDRLYYSSVFYVCTTESTGNLPTDTDYFSRNDSRNAKIKEITLDILLYNLTQRLNNIDITANRVARHEDALIWLKNVSKGLIQPNLPLIEANQTDQTGNIVISVYGETQTDEYQGF